MHCQRIHVQSALLTLIMLAVMSPAAVVAQRLEAKAEAWTPPRTPWGDPDLQGAWTNQTTTPLERPARFGDRVLLSNEEVADLQREADQRGDRPPAPGDPGSVNQFWNEPTRVLARTSLIVDPPDGRLPSLTREAQQSLAARVEYLRAHEADSWEDRNPWERCFGRGMPRTGSNNGSNVQILQGPGFVVVIAEVVHETRMIPVDGRPHLTGNIRQWNGDSRGQWKGQTLVVETTGFLDRPNALLPGIQNTGFGRSAKALRVVERFTRIGRDAIDYEFTVHDPTTFTKSWTVAMPMISLPGGIFEYACHEGNYGLMNILSGHRAQESVAR